MEENYKQLIGEWKKGNFDASIKDGESATSLSNRLDRFIQHLTTIEEKNILVCSHGRALRCIMCLVKGEPLQEMEKYNHSNTGMFLVKYDGERFEVEIENDTKHLEVLE